MSIKTNLIHLKIAFFTLVFVMILIPFHTTFAQNSEGITIDKDVFLQGPIQSPEDLPDEVTFSLYDSEDAIVPLAAQSFPRGEYVLDFDFNKSDGLSSGSVARFKVNFTNKLNLDTDTDASKQPKEIWVEFSINDGAVGNRTRVPDEDMVQLLLAGDASIATYLTLAYEGDGNPITTIYKDLPLASASGFSTNEYITSLFSASASENETFGAANNWLDSGSDVYTMGKVGIGTSTPDRSLIVKYASARGELPNLPAITVANTNTTAGQFSFASFEFSALDGGVLGQFFADGSGHFLNGTPNVYFRATTDSPMLLGTNNLVRMIITNTGNVGIATTDPRVTVDGVVENFTLAVKGKVACQELLVTNTGWADFVFGDHYKLPTLDEVEDFISKNKHLSGVPSEAEVKEKGVSVGNISSKLLQKIEELTLYVIDLKKENDLLKGEVAAIQVQLGNLN